MVLDAKSAKAGFANSSFEPLNERTPTSTPNALILVVPLGEYLFRSALSVDAQRRALLAAGSRAANTTLV